MRSKEEKFQELFASMANGGIFNGAFLAAEHGKVIYQHLHGLADRETARPLTEHSVFLLASVSKPFTAMGILMLHEQDDLDLDAPIVQWFPDLPYHGITVKHLLQHTSGLPDYTALFIKDWDRSRIATSEDVLEYFQLAQPPALFPPGQGFSYTNTGYVLLALLIERISGMSYADYLRIRIFEPLGMTSTHIFNRFQSGTTLPDYAFGYIYSYEKKRFHLPDELPNTDFVVYLDGIQGDGTVHSTLQDLLLWDQALYTEKLVRKQMLEEAFTPAILTSNESYPYGYGWIVEETEHMGKMVAHSGGWPGYHTNLTRYIDQGKTMIFLSNTDYRTEIQLQMLEAAAQILFDLPYSIPNIPAELEAVDINTTSYSMYTGTYKLVKETLGLFNEDLTLTVTSLNDQLFIEFAVQPAFKILPLSESRFFIVELQVQLEFVTKKQGGPSEELILYDQGEQRAVRVQT